MKYKNKEGSPVSLSKPFAQRHSKKKLVECLSNFFYQQKNRGNILKIVLEKLEKITQFFQKQTSYTFYSSSVLIIYDSSDDSVGTEENVVVKLIDFAHTFELSAEKKKIDDNFADGLKNFVQLLTHLYTTDGDTKFSFPKN